MLNHINQVHILTYYILKLNFSISILSKLKSPRDFIPSDFRTKICIFYLSHTCYMPADLKFLDTTVLIIFLTNLQRIMELPKNAVFWDVAPCRYCVNRLVGGIYRLHLQGRKIRERGTSVSRWQAPAHARGFFYPEDGGDIFLRYVGLHNIYTAPHPRRRRTS
jgi:hypothetical protein